MSAEQPSPQQSREGLPQSPGQEQGGQENRPFSFVNELQRLREGMTGEERVASDARAAHWNELIDGSSQPSQENEALLVDLSRRLIGTSMGIVKGNDRIRMPDAEFLTFALPLEGQAILEERIKNARLASHETPTPLPPDVQKSLREEIQASRNPLLAKLDAIRFSLKALAAPGLFKQEETSTQTQEEQAPRPPRIDNFT